MSEAAVATPSVRMPGRGTRVAVAVVAVLAVGLMLPEAWREYPQGLTIPAADWTRAAMKWLTGDDPQSIGPALRTVTRGLAGVFDFFLQTMRSLIATGFRFEPGDGPADIAALPWFAIVAAASVFAERVGGRRLAIATAIGLTLVAVSGHWTAAMVTLASVSISGVVAALTGLGLGILAHRRAGFGRALEPVLDLMQTMPVFSYLVPVLILFGFGPVAGSVATVIYAIPPMVRTTLLGLRQVPPELVEFGRMAGCDERQLLGRILLPMATPQIMVGLNQVVMMTLNFVIIASMIGAGGLGYDVLTALRRLDVGGGLEAGLAIVILAILLDRLTQAVAARAAQPAVPKSGPLVERDPHLAAVVTILLAGLALSLLVPAVAAYPDAAVVTLKPWLNAAVQWINLTFHAPLDAMKVGMLIWVMNPLKHFLLALPWFVPPLLAGLAGLALRDEMLALRSFLMVLALFAVGLQVPAMTTVYLCGLGVAVSALIGLPLGVLGARSDTAHRVLGVVGDTLQTLPAFVYLIPVVMLFRVGDFSALIAIVAYAVVPAIRYTDFGLRRVPDHLVEAGVMAGCRPRQLLWRVRVPMAVPEIMLGINQTLMMALAMLVITALVGTRDLGQETYIALTKADPGRGLVAGFAIAFIAIVADRLIGRWSRDRRIALGLS